MNAIPDYLGDATVLDRREFKRLIRKFKGLRVSLFIRLRDDDAIAAPLDELAQFDVPAKQAIEKLERGDLDAFDWRASEYGPQIWHYAAPIRLQLKRRREWLTGSRMPSEELRLARIVAKLARNPGDDLYQSLQKGCVEGLEKNRAEIERIDRQLAPVPVEPPRDFVSENNSP